MATIQEQIAQARAAGYDDAAIAAHLSNTPDLGPKMKTALDAGYKPADILSHLTGERAAPSAPAAPSEIPKGRSVSGFLSNVGTSAGNLVGGVVSAITSPVETVGGLLDIGAGALQKALPQALVDFVNRSENPEALAAGQRAIKAAEAAGGFYKDRYGSVEAIKKTLYEDPVGATADLSTLFTGGAGLARGAATASRAPIMAAAIRGVPGAEAAATASGALSTAARGLQTAADYTNPLAAVMPTARATNAAVRMVPGVARTMDVAGGAVAGAGRGVYNVVEPMLPGGADAIKARAYLKALDNDPAKINAALQLLQSGKSIEEVAAALQSTGLAAFAKSSQTASTAVQDLYNARSIALAQQQSNQLAGAQQSLNALQQQSLPASTTNPSAPRQVVLRSLAAERAGLQGQEATRIAELTAQAEAAAAKLAEQRAARTSALTAEQQAAEAALAQQRAALHKSLPDVDPSESGAALGQTKERLLKETQTKVTGPAYKKAFELAPDPFSIQSVVDKAKALGQDLLAVLAPNTVPSELGRIQRVFQPPAPPAPALGSGTVSSRMKAPAPETPPAMATLEDAATINRALSAAYGKLSGALPSDTAATALRNNINAIRAELNAAIDRGAPADAVQAYAAARQLHANEVVQPFYTGKLSTTERSTRLGQPQLPPEKIVSAGLSSIQEAQAYVRTFARDPAAMDVLKTGILDQFRRDVGKVTGTGKEVPADKAAQWLDANKEIVNVYDKAGMGLRSEIERIAGQAQGLKTATEGVDQATKAIPLKVKSEFAPAEEALAAQKAAIKPSVAEQFAKENESLTTATKTLDFKTVADLRQKVVKDPMAADLALKRMDAPAKSALARGVMQDVAALPNGAKMLEHLTANEAGIMRVLTANDPKTAAAVMKEAKQFAELRMLAEQTGNKLSAATPQNALAAGQRLETLTKDLPGVRAVITNIQSQLKAGETFETLAAQGKSAGATSLQIASGSVGKTPGSLSRVGMLANLILNRVKGGLDNKLAVEIARELLQSETAAAALAKAQAKTTTKRTIPTPTAAQLRNAAVAGSVTAQQPTNALAP